MQSLGTQTKQELGGGVGRAELDKKREETVPTISDAFRLIVTAGRG